MATSPDPGAEQQSLKLLVKGFAGFDMRLLDGVVKLSKRRNPSLEMVSDAEQSAVDVIMVDGKDSEAMTWAEQQKTWLARQPVVWVDAKQAVPHGHTSINRPVQWTNLPVLLSRAMDDASHDEEGGDIHYDLPAAAPGAAASRMTAPAPVPATPAASASPPKPADELLKSLSDRQKGVPILVVDDSAAVRGHLMSVLKTYGYIVTAVDSGEAGVMAAETGSYACILMDVLMPGIDGYDACRRIKSRGASAPPVVMLTSKSSPFDKIRGKMAGCDAYLTKPVTKSHLMEVLAQHAHANQALSAT
ncbi:MAG: response regulator [Brachymonas sp.]|nr:response regulator [Brachymonas sp.]